MRTTILVLAADLVLLAHLAFIVFVIAGGLLALRWPRAAWFHLPAALWGAAVEGFGWICPLTPLENALRVAAAADGYAGDFIAHYLLPLIYPADMTRELQWLLAVLVLIINALIYSAVWRRRRQRRQHAGRTK